MVKRTIPMLERKRVAQKLLTASRESGLDNLSDGEMLDLIVDAIGDKRTQELLKYEYEATLLRRLSHLIWEE